MAEKTAQFALQILSFLKEYPVTISCISLLIAIFSFTFSLLNFRRKSSIKLRSLYTISSIITTDNKYISQVVIENSKDRSVAIFAIYLHIKPNIYVELSNYEHTPLIIKAYDTITLNYDPVFFYSQGSSRIDLNQLLSSKKSKLRIVVSTPDGKHVIKSTIRYWIPYFQILKNRYTQWIVPITLEYDGKKIGSNIDFLLYVNSQDKETIYQIHRQQPGFLTPKEFELTPKAIENKEKLESHLTQLIKENKISCNSFKIVETKELIERPKKIIQLGSMSWFKYTIIGTIITKILNLTKN
jgi:hypothetical protein